MAVATSFRRIIIGAILASGPFLFVQEVRGSSCLRARDGFPEAPAAADVVRPEAESPDAAAAPDPGEAPARGSSAGLAASCGGLVLGPAPTAEEPSSPTLSEAAPPSTAAPRRPADRSPPYPPPRPDPGASF